MRDMNFYEFDILLRSKESQEKMLEYLGNDILRHIQDLTMNPTLGCPGVILIEHILRLDCVEELIDVKYRKHVSITELEMEVVRKGFDATHIWKPCKDLPPSYDKVKDLLGSKAWKKRLERRHEELQRYQRQILHACGERDSLVGKIQMTSTWTSVIWQIPQRLIDFGKDLQNLFLGEVVVKLDNLDQKLDVVMRKQDDILQMQMDILEMQSNLLHKVSSRIGDLMEFSIKMQQSQVPKLAYLSEIGKKKLLTRFVPGLQEFQLHLMCESRDGVHKVVDQRGCRVQFGSETTRTIVTMLVWGLKTATIVTKIGAHVAGGMVPDFGEYLQLAGLVLDTPGLLDQISALCLGSLPNEVKVSPNITKADRAKAEEWLIKELEERCKVKSTFYEMFGLKKVVYKAISSGKHSTAWLCEHCERNGIQSGKL